MIRLPAFARPLRHALLLAAAAATLALAGCASTSGSHDPRDPLESVNRVTYSVNSNLDKYALKPVAQGYNAVIPEGVRNCVNNVFGNIGDLYVGVNNLLEGNGHDAASDVGRVAMNSTVGVLGCFDVAAVHGLTKHRKDFGITLGVWGLSPGPYIVLPFFGPSDLRDTAGLVPDIYADPVGYLYPVWQRNTIQGIRIIDTRASLINAGNLLQGAALDEYVFVRDGYLTRRRYLIYNGNPPDDSSDDYDEQGSSTDKSTVHDAKDKKSDSK